MEKLRLIIRRCLCNTIGCILYKFNRMAILYQKEKVSKSLNCDNTQIGEELKVICPENIYIGKWSYINGGGELHASPHAVIKIGENCLISYKVHIRTDMHNYMDINKKINQQGNCEKSIIIKDDVWIGYGAQIMAGVTIVEGCVIGAGAVVTRDTQPYGVYAGVPAGRIKERK